MTSDFAQWVPGSSRHLLDDPASAVAHEHTHQQGAAPLKVNDLDSVDVGDSQAEKRACLKEGSDLGDVDDQANARANCRGRGGRTCGTTERDDGRQVLPLKRSNHFRWGGRGVALFRPFDVLLDCGRLNPYAYVQGGCEGFLRLVAATHPLSFQVSLTSWRRNT